MIPALATTISTGPCAASTAVNARSTAAASVTSHATAGRPSGASPDLEVTVTRYPSARNRRAIARPMPRLPPVTRTDRPLAFSSALAIVSATSASSAGATRQTLSGQGSVRGQGMRPDSDKRQGGADEQNDGAGDHPGP